MVLRHIKNGVTHKTVHQGCLTPFAGTREIRHNIHLASAALIGQSIPVEGHDHKRQGTPASKPLGLFFTAVRRRVRRYWRAKHRSIRPVTSTPLTYKLNETIRPYQVRPTEQQHTTNTALSGLRTHDVVGSSAACRSILVPCACPPHPSL